MRDLSTAWSLHGRRVQRVRPGRAVVGSDPASEPPVKRRATEKEVGDSTQALADDAGKLILASSATAFGVGTAGSVVFIIGPSQNLRKKPMLLKCRFWKSICESAVGAMGVPCLPTGRAVCGWGCNDDEALG
ncbi:Rcc1 [Symbiodinium sp. CCMP2592]|nr:Rcc1 [Symbiodinium sp. CCMP2592]